MEWQSWIMINEQQVIGITISVVVFYFCLILFTRIAGLRSFSKLSSYDLAMTIGIGSILASTVVSKSTSLMQGIFAVGMLFLLQSIVSIVRRKIKPVKDLLDNQPIILMANGEYLWDNLKEAKLSTNDVKQVLRQNGVKSPSEVFAVIMETTADMSVIKNNDAKPDWSLFDDVRDKEILMNSINNTTSHKDMTNR
ncbi:DUF421 domain-containing protein [Psychrobacter sp. DM8]|uniref:DUF421 domain-containing protein n=1 Tax=unclassified Psychrobacter TaxID=196806 RepID=UPI003F502461